MFRDWWIWFLTHLYKLLIVRVQALDIEKIRGYEKLKILGEVDVQSNLGKFTFIFKEDRRNQIRDRHAKALNITSYFVELRCPETLKETNNIFQQKAILVVKLKISNTNYDALGKTLLETYVDAFRKPLG